VCIPCIQGSSSSKSLCCVHSIGCDKADQEKQDMITKNVAEYGLTQEVSGVCPTKFGLILSWLGHLIHVNWKKKNGCNFKTSAKTR